MNKVPVIDAEFEELDADEELEGFIASPGIFSGKYEPIPNK